MVRRASTAEGKARRKHGYKASSYARAQEAKTSGGSGDVYQTGISMEDDVSDFELAQ